MGQELETLKIKKSEIEQKALDELSQHEGETTTLLCRCPKENENLWHRSLVKQMIIDREANPDLINQSTNQTELN